MGNWQNWAGGALIWTAIIFGAFQVGGNGPSTPPQEKAADCHKLDVDTSLKKEGIGCIYKTTQMEIEDYGEDNSEESCNVLVKKHTNFIENRDFISVNDVYNVDSVRRFKFVMVIFLPLKVHTIFCNEIHSKGAVTSSIDTDNSFGSEIGVYYKN